MNNNDLELQWQACCEKMEILMAQLPEMEALQALCARLERAQAVADKAKELYCLEVERDRSLAEVKKYRDAGKIGPAAYIENQIGYHVGLLRSAEKDLNALLASTGYASAEEASSFLSANAPLETLKTRVSAFSQEYADTLAKLTELDALLTTEE